MNTMFLMNIVYNISIAISSGNSNKIQKKPCRGTGPITQRADWAGLYHHRQPDRGRRGFLQYLL